MQTPKLFYRLHSLDKLSSPIRELDGMRSEFLTALPVRLTALGVGVPDLLPDSQPEANERRYRLRKQYPAIICEYEEY